VDTEQVLTVTTSYNPEDKALTSDAKFEVLESMAYEKNNESGRVTVTGKCRILDFLNHVSFYFKIFIMVNFNASNLNF